MAEIFYILGSRWPVGSVDLFSFFCPFLFASFCPCFVSRFSFISLCLSFSLFRWPRPWPYFALLYLTLPSLTLLSRNSKNRSINTDFQQRPDPRSSCPPNWLIMSKSIQVFNCRHRVQVVILKVPCVCDVCVWSKRAPGSAEFLQCMVVWEYNADVNSRRCAGSFVRVRGFCLSGVGWLFFSSAVSLLGVLASRLPQLKCRHFLAGQFFLSGDVCCWAFVSRVPCVSL